MRRHKWFVVKLPPRVDGAAAPPVTALIVPPLRHKARNHAVEGHPRKAGGARAGLPADGRAARARRQRHKVGHRPRRARIKQPERQPPDRRVVVRHVQVDARRRRGGRRADDGGRRRVGRGDGDGLRVAVGVDRGGLAAATAAAEKDDADGQGNGNGGEDCQQHAVAAGGGAEGGARCGQRNQAGAPARHSMRKRRTWGGRVEQKRGTDALNGERKPGESRRGIVAWRAVSVTVESVDALHWRGIVDPEHVDDAADVPDFEVARSSHRPFRIAVCLSQLA